MPLLDITAPGMVNGPSNRHMHKWSVDNLAPLHATLLARTAQQFPAADEELARNRTVSHAYPLSSHPESIVSKSVVHQRAEPDPRVLSLLHGIPEVSPRLRPFDRTQHQRVAQIRKPSAYALDYCRPAAIRAALLRTKSALPPVSSSGEEAGMTLSPRTYQLIATESLAVPYHPSQHGVRSITKRGRYGS